MPRLISGASALTRSTGSILQVKYTQFTGTNQVTSSANTDTVVTDLTVNITPTTTNSIIKIQASVNGEWSVQTAAIEGTWLFFRDSTALKAPAAGNRNRGILMSTNGDSDTGSYERGISFISATEIMG